MERVVIFIKGGVKTLHQSNKNTKGNKDLTKQPSVSPFETTKLISIGVYSVITSHPTSPFTPHHPPNNIARKPNQPRLMFDLEKLRDPDMKCTFQATIGGKFAPVVDLRYEDIGISVAMPWTSKPRSRQDQGHSCYF